LASAGTITEPWVVEKEGRLVGKGGRVLGRAAGPSPLGGGGGGGDWYGEIWGRGGGWGDPVGVDPR